MLSTTRDSGTDQSLKGSVGQPLFGGFYVTEVDLIGHQSRNGTSPAGVASPTMSEANLAEIGAAALGVLLEKEMPMKKCCEQKLKRLPSMGGVYDPTCLFDP